DGSIGTQKEGLPSRLGPLGKLIITRSYLVPYFFNAENATTGMCLHKPVSEGRTKVHPVMEVLGTNEHIGIQQICHQNTIPNSWPKRYNVSTFLTPKSRKASVNEVCPSKVLVISARAKRLPARAVWLR
ncbi:MAG: hypothetical protein PWP50_1232, partial [Synergistaceae bacterium]|nr:hypothetical protein [Synergistaceae bacterium]